MSPIRVLLAITLALLVALGGRADAAGPEIGQIKVASGPVQIERGAEKIRPRPGTPLFEGDKIVTGKTGAVGMTFSDNARMSLGPSSELVLTSYAFNQPGRTDGFEANLNGGSLRAESGEIVKRQPLSMRVVMPTATLGVRGTEFAVRVDPTGDTKG